MSGLLTKLFSLRPGEGNKTFLFYSLYFVFYLGLTWGGNACLALFLDAWGANYLDSMFIGDAFLLFGSGLIYTFFADRLNHERLLLTLLSLMLLWLVSVWLLLGVETYSGPGGMVYPYFYLAYNAFRDLVTLHMLTYVNNFYDTRAAKSALPLIMSAITAASAVAGFSAAPLIKVIGGLKNMPLAWGVCLILVITLIYLIRRRMPPEVSQLQPARRATRDKAPSGQGPLDNLRSGFHFARESRFLRWLALASLIMIILMNLLFFQSSQIFKSYYENDSAGLFRFYNLVTAYSNIVWLPLQMLFLGRLVTYFGVSRMSLAFPSFTLLAIGALNFWGNMVTATFGELNRSILRKAFYQPLDAMLYNSMPLHLKGRARAFINGLVVPIGILGAGLLLLAVRLGGLSAGVLTGLGLTLGLAYIVMMLQVRAEYSHALADLLADDEISIFHMSQAGHDHVDPIAEALVHRRLNESQDYNRTIFLAELLYTIQGRNALVHLQSLATQREPKVCAGIIELAASDWITDPAMRNFCLDRLKDGDPAVRRAAVTALAGAPDAAQDETLLAAFLELLTDSDEMILVQIIPPLIASGDFYYLAPAVQTLSSWLTHETDNQRRAMGLRVLAKTGAERMIRTLVRYLNDPAPLIRRQVAELIDDLAAQTPLEAVKRLGLETLSTLLADSDESVRLTAVSSLARFRSVEASRALLVAFGDPNFEVRRQACVAMKPILKRELEVILDSDNHYQAECATFILAGANQARAKRYIVEIIRTLVIDAYTLHIQRFSLQTFDTLGARLLKTSLQEKAGLFLDRVFWLLSALSDEKETQAIRRSLQSEISLKRANAAETLEAITSPQLCQLIVPLGDGAALPVLAQRGQEMLGLPLPAAWQLFQQLWPQLKIETAPPAAPANQNLAVVYRDDWFKASAIYTLLEMNETMARPNGWPFTPEIVRAALRATLNDHSPLVQETVRLAQTRLEPSHQHNPLEGSMLTTIEKVIFLKEVSFFQDMTVDQLRTLAGISEEVTYNKNQQIFTEGEYGDALLVIISGRVAIQRQTKGRRATLVRLATLGPRDYFGEMSIFDNEPYSTDAVALEPTELLLVRQAPLVALIKHQPDLALGLLKVLSQRLRQANALIAEKTEAKPKQLMDLYDRLD